MKEGINKMFTLEQVVNGLEEGSKGRKGKSDTFKATIIVQRTILKANVKDTLTAALARGKDSDALTDNQEENPDQLVSRICRSANKKISDDLKAEIQTYLNELNEAKTEESAA